MGRMRDLGTLWQIFISMARAGVLGFGGGQAFIPLIEAEVVTRYHWMTTEQFVDAIAVGNALPGPIATKLAGYVGYKIYGWPGAVAGLLGMVIPSAVAMIVLFALLTKYKNVPWVAGIIRGVRPVVVVLLALMVIEIIPKSISSVTTAMFAAVAFVLLYFLKIHPALVVLMAMAAGALILH